MSYRLTHSLLAGVAAITLAGAAFAQVPASPAPGSATHAGMHHEWTLEEARKHAHERADMLDKMTPEQFAAEQQAHKAKWSSLTPDQKAALKAMHHPDGATPPPPPPGQ